MHAPQDDARARPLHHPIRMECDAAAHPERPATPLAPLARNGVRCRISDLNGDSNNGAATGEPLRRDRDRRRAQRVGGRRLPRQARRPDRGAGETAQDRWRGRHQRTVARRAPRGQGQHAQLHDEPHAAVAPPRPAAGTVRVQAAAAGAGLPADAGRRVDRPVRRRREDLRVDRATVQARRRRLRALLRVDRPDRRHHGPAADADAAEPGLEEAQGHQGRRPTRVGAAQAGGPADGGRHHASVHDERHRPARPMVREPADDGVHGGQRHHRHVGRAGRAGHGLRDDASLRGRHRRR